MFILDFEQVDVTYHYPFESPGYQLLEIDQKWELIGTEHLSWTLRPASTSAVPGALPASASDPAVLAYNAGIVAFKAKDFATAEAKFKESVVHDPKLRQGWGALSSAHLELGHYKEAAEAAEKAIALGSIDEAVLTARWQAYRNLKDDAKATAALADLDRIGRRAEEAKRIHNEGVALAKAGDDAGAFPKLALFAALSPGPEYRSAHISAFAANVAALSGDLGIVIQKSRYVLTLYKGMTPVRELLGRIRQRVPGGRQTEERRQTDTRGGILYLYHQPQQAVLQVPGP